MSDWASRETPLSADKLAALFVSLELSRSTWVATSMASGSKKICKHKLVGGDGRELPDFLPLLKTRVEQRIAAPVKLAEVGLDGFWAIRQRRKCTGTAG